MIVKKVICDCCLKEFDYEKTSNVVIYGLTLNTYRGCNSYVDEQPYSTNSIHLCNECWEKIESYIESIRCKND
jgi:hypothetical protein